MGKKVFYAAGPAAKPLSESYYTVRTGRVTGIFTTWADCEIQVIGFPGAKFQRFKNRTAAEAWLNKDNGGANTVDAPEEGVSPA